MELNSFSDMQLILKALDHMEPHLGEYAPIVASKYYDLRTRLNSALAGSK